MIDFDVYKIINKIIAKKRKQIRDLVFRISRKEIFFNFSFFMKKGSFFCEISLFACEKKRDFLNFFFHMKKNHEKMSKISDFLRKEKRFFSHFSLREIFFFNFPSFMREGNFFCGISLPACGKGRDCLLISLLNGHLDDR